MGLKSKICEKDNGRKYLSLIYDSNSIYEFYKDIDNFEKTDKSKIFGDLKRFKKYKTSDEAFFRGLPLAEIQNHKYQYPKPLEFIKNGLNINLNFGFNSKKYEFNEFDGDDMNFDRFIDGFPAFSKRVTKHNNKRIGKVINIFVNIAENCNISAEQLLSKAKFTIKLIDYLESCNFRTQVYCMTACSDYGKFSDYEGYVNFGTKICIKKAEDNCNLNLIYNLISPWFFRYYLFLVQVKSYRASYGLGCAEPLHKVFDDIPEKSDITNIIIDKEECLDEEGIDKKIKQLQKIYN